MPVSENKPNLNSRYLLRSAVGDEIRQCLVANSASWAGPLTESQYVERERFLHTQEICQSRHEYFVLVDMDDKEIVGACEILARPGYWVDQDPHGNDFAVVFDIDTFSLGAVFVPEQQRGKGIASVMLKYVESMLRTRMENYGGAILYSEIGPDYYEKFGFKTERNATYVANAMKWPEFFLEADISNARPSMLRIDDFTHLTAKEDKELQKYILTRYQNDPMHTPRWCVSVSAAIINWHTARSEFVGGILREDDQRSAKYGAQIGEQWVAWMHDYASHSLYILHFGGFMNKDITQELKSQAMALVKAAIEEAKKLNLENVYIWPESGKASVIRSLFPTEAFTVRKTSELGVLPARNALFEGSCDRLPWF
ncbi:hypothetical protein CANCADRAFT_134939 [Tortispora caseinolytica NRRL Y-17796]|uniref:N-acetyltransferase domain-containing protein n=1 Tax=Tortispora caseinolytica NRRL Y-17796 TaxID=767744 RepID=A0A1E4TBU4_9ASCO|nr:hypothetical protein CANCADRAFT_134939 [Tortispora caseinolytica NRRL Y-17796]